MRYLTIEQTAGRLGRSNQEVSVLIQEGRLPAVNISLEPGHTRAHYRIPGRKNRKVPIEYDKHCNGSRHVIENFFCRIKDHRRVATATRKPPPSSPRWSCFLASSSGSNIETAHTA